MKSDTVYIANTEEELPVQNTYGKTSYLAWIVMLECMAVILVSALMLLTASSTPVATAAWLNVSFSQLNWIANAAAIVDVITSCTTFYINDKYGIKKSIILGTVITTVGCWIRWIAVLVPVHHRYTVFIIGQTFGSIGNPIVENVVTKLVATWFAPQHRTIATSLLTLHIGGVSAPIILPVIAKTAEGVPKMLIVTACICTVCSVPAFFLPRKPKTAPSVTAESSRVSSWKGVKLIFKNVTFWWIVVASSIQFGVSMAFSTVMLEVIVPYGYTQQQAGLCEAALMISGCLGGCISGYWLGESGRYVVMVKVFSVCSVLSCALLTINIIPNAFPTVLTTCMLYGFFGFGVSPLFFELASELTYPISESISMSIIWTVASINMLIFTVIFDALRAGEDANPPYHMKNSMIAATCLLAVGSIPCLWIKGDLKRLQVDEKAVRCCEQSISS